MNRYKSFKAALVVCVLVICFGYFAPNASANLCSTFDFATNTVRIPCFNLDDTWYWMDLGLVTDGLEIKDFGDNGLAQDSSMCATFSFLTNTLHVPCFDFEGVNYWMDLELVSSDPILLRLKDYGINSSSKWDVMKWDVDDWG